MSNYENKYLIDTAPLILLKELACIIGVNESIILQQVHYLVRIHKETNSNFYDGKYWTYDSYPDWREKFFPFWSEDTVKRAFGSLYKADILIKGNYNQKKYDQTLWWTIDYEWLDTVIKIGKLMSKKQYKEHLIELEKEHNDSSVQIAPTPMQDAPISDNNDFETDHAICTHPHVECHDGQMQNAPIGDADCPSVNGKMPSPIPNYPTNESPNDISNTLNSLSEQKINYMNTLWTATLKVLQNEMTVVSYNSWIKNLVPIYLDNQFNLTLETESKFEKGVIESRYKTIIKNAIKTAINKDYEIIITAKN